jgi:hypothetical protein
VEGLRAPRVQVKGLGKEVGIARSWCSEGGGGGLRAPRVQVVGEREWLLHHIEQVLRGVESESYGAQRGERSTRPLCWGGFRQADWKGTM